MVDDHGLRRNVRPNLIMTDLVYLLALALALLYVLVEPMGWRLGKIALTKHLPLIVLVVPSFILTLVGARIFHLSRSFPRVTSSFLPLLGFALFVVTGSLYARYHLKIHNTFLFTGIYMLAAPFAAYMLIHSGNARRMLHVYQGLLMVSGLVVTAGLVRNYGIEQVYHELEFLVPPLAVFFAFSGWRKGMHRFWIFVFLIAAVLFKKNSGYLTGLLVVAYLIWFGVWPAQRWQDSLRKTANLYVLATILLAFAAAALFLWSYKDAYLPSGNPQYRMLTYENTWRKFIASPWWGTFFSGPATEKFEGFDTGVANNVLPSHSDILDILANGGIIGAILWFWTLARIGRLAWSGILQWDNRTHPLAPYAHMMACMSLAAVLVYAFNPILLQPSKALLVWTNLGLLGGIALLFKRDVAEGKWRSET